MIDQVNEESRDKFKKVLVSSCFSDTVSIQKAPWYTGFPLSRVLPYMRITRNNNTVWLFIALFIYIIVT